MPMGAEAGTHVVLQDAPKSANRSVRNVAFRPKSGGICQCSQIATPMTYHVLRSLDLWRRNSTLCRA